MKTKARAVLPPPQKVLVEAANALEAEAETYHHSFTFMGEHGRICWTDQAARRCHKQYTRLVKQIRESIW